MAYRRSVRKRQGFSLLEALIAAFTLLVCALIFAAAMPIANKSRGKAQYANTALSLAQKQIETLRHLGFANADAGQMKASGLIDSTTLTNLQTEMVYGDASDQGYEFTDCDVNASDSVGELLPHGRGFVMVKNDEIDLRRVEVIVFWVESDEYRFVKLTTYLAHL